MKTQRKRRMQKKTDYLARIGMLKSGIPRIVARKTNKYIILQYVKSDEAKDSVLIGVTSKNLLKHGWPENLKGSLKSIFDIGLQRNISGGRLYAVLNGLVDSGLEISHDKKVFPSEERIKGKHLKSDLKEVFDKVRKNIEK